MPNGRHNVSCGFCSKGNGPREDVTCNRFDKVISVPVGDSFSVLCSEFEPNQTYLSNLDNYPDDKERILENLQQRKSKLPVGKLCQVSVYAGVSVIMDLE